MEELMMNLFSLIADQVRNKQELFDQEASIMQVLLNEGYHIQEAETALTLMQTLVKKQAETFFGPGYGNGSYAVRTMNSEERRRFTPDAFLFALKLTHLGILSEDQREEILERAMHFYRERIELRHIKALVAFMLFTTTGEREDLSPSSFRNMKNTAWN